MGHDDQPRPATSFRRRLYQVLTGAWTDHVGTDVRESPPGASTPFWTSVVNAIAGDWTTTASPDAYRESASVRGRGAQDAPAGETVPRPQAERSTAARPAQAESPGQGEPAPTRPLYQAAGVVITDSWFIVAGHRYALADFDKLRTGRGPRHPLTMRAMVTSTVILLSMAALLGLTADPTHLPGGVFLALAAAGAAPLILAVAGERLRPRPWELWADYKGITVRLFTTDNEARYGQVARALLRAREINKLSGDRLLGDKETWHTWQRKTTQR